MKLKNILGFLYATYLIMSQIMTIVFLSSTVELIRCWK